MAQGQSHQQLTVPSLSGVSVKAMKGTWPVLAASKAVHIPEGTLLFEEGRVNLAGTTNVGSMWGP